MGKIKGKPDTSMFSQMKDPTKFLEGASSEHFETTSSKPLSNNVSDAKKTEPVFQKQFRLRLDTINVLKVGAAQESVDSGKRVTETEIVERLIRKYYKLPK